MPHVPRDQFCLFQLFLVENYQILHLFFRFIGLPSLHPKSLTKSSWFETNPCKNITFKSWSLCVKAFIFTIFTDLQSKIIWCMSINSEKLSQCLVFVFATLHDACTDPKHLLWSEVDTRKLLLPSITLLPRF